MSGSQGFTPINPRRHQQHQQTPHLAPSTKCNPTQTPLPQNDDTGPHDRPPTEPHPCKPRPAPARPAFFDTLPERPLKPDRLGPGAASRLGPVPGRIETGCLDEDPSLGWTKAEFDRQGDMREQEAGGCWGLAADQDVRAKFEEHGVWMAEKQARDELMAEQREAKERAKMAWKQSVAEVKEARKRAKMEADELKMAQKQARKQAMAEMKEAKQQAKMEKQLRKESIAELEAATWLERHGRLEEAKKRIKQKKDAWKAQCLQVKEEEKEKRKLGVDFTTQ